MPQSATIAITGVTAHPMSAKGVMVNPVRVAADLIAQFDPLQTPEHTDLRDGYWWFNQVDGRFRNEARLQISIRDFDAAEKFAARKRHVEDGSGDGAGRCIRAPRIECLIEDQYGNIAALARRRPQPCIELVRGRIRGDRHRAEG